MTIEDENKVIDLMAKSAAFSHYKEKGLAFVQKSYPEQFKFVEANKDKDYFEVVDKIADEIRAITLKSRE